MYGATKIFLTEFGASIAGELRHLGIDVLVFHPSPVDTAFYKGENVDKSGALMFFKKRAVPPTVIADSMFASVGKFGVVKDQGIITILLHILLKVMDYNLIAIIGCYTVPHTSDYKKLKAVAEQVKKTN